MYKRQVYYFSCDQNRIDGQKRGGSMSAFSVNMDLNTVAGSKNSAGFPEKLPGFCAVLKGPDGSSCFLSGLFFILCYIMDKVTFCPAVHLCWQKPGAVLCKRGNILCITI